MKLRKITIREASYQASDIPKEFTVVLNLDKDKDLQGLKSKTLNGVTGLSAKGHVKYDRVCSTDNIILIMDANEVLKINKLSRMMYDNPDYFFSNNMKALHRILDNNTKSDILQILIEWIFEHLFEDIKINTDDVSTNIVIKILNNKINSVKDLWRSCKSAANILLIKEENNNKQNSFKIIIKSTYENFKYATQKAIEDNIKDRFDYEAEWIVKNEILNIPIKSKLMIMLDDNKLIIDKVQKSGIDKIYNIEYVNFKNWARKQNVWSRFTKIY